MRISSLILTLLIALTSLAQTPKSAHPIYPATTDHPPPAWFIDVASKAGITVRNVNGSIDHKRYIIEATGSGVAIIDYDRDGWPDIFLVNGHEMEDQANPRETPPTSHLFRNNHDGTFTDVTAKAGLTSTGWGQGACVGDYDNDGFDDLYVTGYGNNRLFHNQGNGTFQRSSPRGRRRRHRQGVGHRLRLRRLRPRRQARPRRRQLRPLRSRQGPQARRRASAASGKAFPSCAARAASTSAPNVLYHNLGNGKFEDVSKSSGIEKTTGHYCFSVTTLDYDDDGWPDIYMACDSTPAILYHNNHDGTFTDTAADAGVAFNEDGREQAGMGSTAADYDGDGRIDIFKTNFSDDTSTLYHNNGDGTYSDVTFPAGLGINTDALGWGAIFADVDNDGWPDLLLVNGHVYPEVDSAKLGAVYRERRFLYYNLGNGKFRDITKDSGPGLQTPMSGRGLAIADLWNDGRLEAVVNNLSDLPLLLVNLAKNNNHWLGLQLIGTLSNRDAIGARVTLHGEHRIWVDEVRSGSSYNSSSDLRLHFGLGQKRRSTPSKSAGRTAKQNYSTPPESTDILK